MAERSTRIRSSQISAVKPDDLQATNSPSDNYIPSYDLATTNFTWVASGGAGEAIEKSVNQSLHGFSVGDVLKFNGSIYAKAQANSEANAEVTGLVSTVVDVNNFIILYDGYVSGLSGLTAGNVYFLSDSTAGALISTEPATEGYISKPLLIALSTTTGIFKNWRGSVIGLSGLFDIDESGNIQPITEVAADDNFELDISDNIMPRA